MARTTKIKVRKNVTLRYGQGQRSPRSNFEHFWKMLRMARNAKIKVPKFFYLKVKVKGHQGQIWKNAYVTT